MLLHHLGEILPPHDSKKRETAIAWSPDSTKLALTSVNCTVHLFDDKCVKKDEFCTKAINAQNHTIKGLSFSPDSTKLAVGHTDGFVKVYHIGDEWGKKIIELELHQGSSVTCLVWPIDELIVVGLENGKVNTISMSARTSTVLYDANSTTIALAINSRSTGILSSHADGKINRYKVTDQATIEYSASTILHPVAAQALALTHHNYILAAGRDRRIIFYDSRGKCHQMFSFCIDGSSTDGIVIACCNYDGQSVAVGTWEGMRILNLSPRTNLWESTTLTILPKGGTVIALSWRRDGTQLTVGSANGAVERYEVSVRSALSFGSKGYEVLYVEASLAIVSSLSNDDRSDKPIVIRSRSGQEIEDVKLLGNHVIARTATTLLICEINSDLVNEIPRDNDKEIPIQSSSNGEKQIEHKKEFNTSSKQPTITSVSFEPKNGISLKASWIQADSTTSTTSRSVISKCSSKNESDNNDVARKEKTNRRANSLVYSTKSKADTFLRSNVSDKVNNVSSNRKTYASEDSICWTLNLDSSSSSRSRVSENEVLQNNVKKNSGQKRLQNCSETIGSNDVSSLVNVQKPNDKILANTSELSYADKSSSWLKNSTTRTKSESVSVGRSQDYISSEAYKTWSNNQEHHHQVMSSSSTSSTPEISLPGLNATSPIRFTRQYTPEELRGDFSLQLAVMASLSPGLQRVLEKQTLNDEKIPND